MKYDGPGCIYRMQFPADEAEFQKRLCHLSLTLTTHNPKIMLIEDNIQLAHRVLSN